MRRTRLILGLVAVVLLLFMVYSFLEYDAHNPQIKEYEQFFETPTLFNNTELSFSAEVLAVDSMNHTMQVSLQVKPYASPPVALSAGDFDVHVLKKGDRIDGSGVFHGDGSITATRLWVIGPWETAMVYVRSLLAVPFVVFLFFRTWEWKSSVWRFERRKRHA